MDAAEAGQGEVLVADVGNTETRLGLARDGELAATWATTTPEHLTADEAYLVLRGCSTCTPPRAAAARSRAAPSWPRSCPTSPSRGDGRCSACAAAARWWSAQA